MWGNWYWPRGLVIVSLAFAVPELYALATNVQNTLSWYCWRELGVGSVSRNGIHTLAWWCSIIAWLLFTVVITAHIWFGEG